MMTMMMMMMGLLEVLLLMMKGCPSSPVRCAVTELMMTLMLMRTALLMLMKRSGARLPWWHLR